MQPQDHQPRLFRRDPFVDSELFPFPKTGTPIDRPQIACHQLAKLPESDLIAKFERFKQFIIEDLTLVANFASSSRVSSQIFDLEAAAKIAFELSPELREQYQGWDFSKLNKKQVFAVSGSMAMKIALAYNEIFYIIDLEAGHCHLATGTVDPSSWKEELFFDGTPIWLASSRISSKSSGITHPFNNILFIDDERVLVDSIGAYQRLKQESSLRSPAPYKIDGAMNIYGLNNLKGYCDLFCFPRLINRSRYSLWINSTLSKGQSPDYVSSSLEKAKLVVLPSIQIMGTEPRSPEHNLDDEQRNSSVEIHSNIMTRHFASMMGIQDEILHWIEKKDFILAKAALYDFAFFSSVESQTTGHESATEFILHMEAKMFQAGLNTLNIENLEQLVRQVEGRSNPEERALKALEIVQKILLMSYQKKFAKKLG